MSILSLWQNCRFRCPNANPDITDPEVHLFDPNRIPLSTLPPFPFLIPCFLLHPSFYLPFYFSSFQSILECFLSAALHQPIFYSYPQKTFTIKSSEQSLCSWHRLLPQVGEVEERGHKTFLTDISYVTLFMVGRQLSAGDKNNLSLCSWRNGAQFPVLSSLPSFSHHILFLWVLQCLIWRGEHTSAFSQKRFTKLSFTQLSSLINVYGK